MSNPTLVDSVRNWVHFDNLCIMLSRQIATARNMRATFEDRVLSLLGSTKRLRIKGALLEPAVKKTNINLNWTTLEESLHKYFDSVKKPDQTEEILNFMRENRGTKSSSYLKKTPLIDDVENVAVTNSITH